MARTLVVLAMVVMGVTCGQLCPDGCVCSSPGRCTAKCSRPSEDTRLTHLARVTHVTHSPHLSATSSFTRLWTLINNAARTELTHLTIHDCDVRHLNVSLVGQKYLQTLDMSYNSITEVGESFARSLPALKSFTLHGNSISTLGNSWLRYLKELQILDLSSNKICALLQSPFESFNLLTLNLSRNKVSSLSEISLKGLASLQSLDLSSNLISMLDNSLFNSLSSLQWLNLSGNRLEMLSEEYFVGLAHLQTLDVSANRISTITSGSFESLSGLTELLLADNPLGSLQKELLFLVGTGRRLQTVDASTCNLSDVPATLTWSIRVLKLSSNKITSIRRGDLDSYPLLQTLDMSDNQITDIEEDALGRLELLTSLILSGNKLRVIPNSLPDSLRILHLPHNNIEFLNVGDLQATPKLTELVLRQSNMRAIQDGAFASVLELEVLDLSDNPIERLCSSVLAGPQRVRVLRLSHLRYIASEEASEMSFPITSPERLEILELNASPVLARQLMADTAALAAFRQLHELDLKDTNLTHIRSDLFHFFPRLDVFRLSTNLLECEGILWLSRWMRQRKEKDPWAFAQVRCASPKHLASKLVVQLSEVDFDTAVSSSFTRPTISRTLDSPTRQQTLPEKRQEGSPRVPIGPLNGEANVSENAVENSSTDGSHGVDVQLEITTPKTATRQDTLIDRSSPSSSHREFLPPDSLLNETGFKNARKTSDATENATTSSTFRNNSKDINQTDQLNNASSAASSDPVRHDNRQMTGSLINNVTKQDVNDFRDIFNGKMEVKAAETEVTDNQGLEKNSTQSVPIVNSKQHLFSPKQLGSVSQNVVGATLRNANKKMSRNLNANVTSGGDFLFDKMMRDRLANNSRISDNNNNRVRANENFSRVKSSSSFHQNFENRTLTTKDSISTSATGNSERNQSAIKAFNGSLQSVSVLPIASNRSSSLSDTTLSIAHARKSENKGSTNSNLLPSEKPERNLTKFTVPNELPISNRNPNYNKILDNEEDYLNTSAVWGTIKSMSNINLSNSSANKSELLIGIVRTKESDPPVRPHHHIDKSSLLFRAQTSNANAFASSGDIRRHRDHVDRERDSASSRKLFGGSHPGMFVLLALGVGAIIGLAGGLVHCARKRRRLAVEYSRQQDIEVRSMTSLGERERW